MKVVDKEKLIRKNGAHSALVYLQSDDNQKETSILFNIQDEYFRFNVFHKENYSQNDIDNWWSDSEVEKLLEQNKDRIFEYKKWGCDLSEGGQRLIAIKM